ncbi:hypothetical protein [Halomonas halocynthiae]|uniref:hypothetical protein n=1 Tax=Halomonas halocynthiae TaxID=176290 RepID=UPI000483EAB7|nr:hypothetical protein [Halomonas halocynthiae]
MKFKLLVVLVACFVFSCAANPMKQYQEDADLIRLEHLEYWTDIINKYYQIKGSYPFQEEIQNSKDIVLVKIATKQQMQYLSSGGDKYEKRLDNNQSGYFKERSVKDFVAEVEAVLGHQIEEKYDIQKVPTSSPVGYYYFTSEDGYLVWVTCITCGVTQVSTLLMDGVTPTVNIVSEGMVGKVTKALTREEMLNHPTYKSWVSRPFHKSEYMHNLVKENSHDSK